MNPVRRAPLRRTTLRRMWRRVVRQMACAVPVVLVMLVMPAWAGFTAQATNPGNSIAAGTVSLTDNDSNDTLPLFSLTNVKPGDTSSSCIQVTYTGSLPATVKLFGTTTGTGLDPYLNLTVTRGTISSGSFTDCTNFTADATNYLGSGAGVLYTGTLQAFPDSYAASTVNDKHSTTLNETWTTNEVHSYKLTLTVADDNAGQGLTATQAFTWQAANTTAYSDVILSDNPVDYWKLDEANGATTAVNAANAAHNGTYTGSPVIGQTSGVKDAGTAAGFDQSNDYIAGGDYNDFAGNVAFSVECWVNTPPPNAQSPALVSKIAANANGGWMIYLESTGTGQPNSVTARRYDASGVGTNIVSNFPLTSGVWHHVVVTYESGTGRFRTYIDSDLKVNSPALAVLPNIAAPVVIGAKSDLVSQRYAGLMDEVAIYNYQLDQQQVTEHYNAGLR